MQIEHTVDDELKTDSTNAVRYSGDANSNGSTIHEENSNNFDEVNKYTCIIIVD